MLGSSPFASPRSMDAERRLQDELQNEQNINSSCFNVKIADLGNACWTVSYFLILCCYLSV